MARLLGGGLAGLLATFPMSFVIVLGRKVGMLWTPPPKQITGRVAKKAGVEPHADQEAFTLSWVAAHFGYGAACGAIYSVARPLLPANRRVAGMLFGGVVWGVSYLGYIPAIGLYPWPKDDSKSRMAVMIAAHAVYGVATSQIDQALFSTPEAANYPAVLQSTDEFVYRQA
ncbi:MAG: DUF6789 family protein [Thermomicrobiales bacterium]